MMLFCSTNSGKDHSIIAQQLHYLSLALTVAVYKKYSQHFTEVKFKSNYYNFDQYYELKVLDYNKKV